VESRIWKKEYGAGRYSMSSASPIFSERMWKIMTGQKVMMQENAHAWGSHRSRIRSAEYLIRKSWRLIPNTEQKLGPRSKAGIEKPDTYVTGSYHPK